MTLSPQAQATYQQYRKANEMLDKLKDAEQKIVVDLLNGDLRLEPSTETANTSR